MEKQYLIQQNCKLCSLACRGYGWVGKGGGGVEFAYIIPISRIFKSNLSRFGGDILLAIHGAGLILRQINIMGYVIGVLSFDCERITRNVSWSWLMIIVDAGTIGAVIWKISCIYVRIALILSRRLILFYQKYSIIQIICVMKFWMFLNYTCTSI